MEGELYRLERQVASLDRTINRLLEVLVQTSTTQHIILGKLNEVIALLEPATTFPASTGGTVTVR